LLLSLSAFSLLVLGATGQNRLAQPEQRVPGVLGHSSQACASSSLYLLNGNFNGFEMFNEHIHPLAGIHITTSVNIYRTASGFRKGMDGEMRFSQCVYNGNTLRVELMREPIKNGCTAGFDRFFECGSNPIEIIQQMECDAIKAYENVVSQRMLLLFWGVLKTLFDFVT
jgi:hypothetical protein